MRRLQKHNTRQEYTQILFTLERQPSHLQQSQPPPTPILPFDRWGWKLAWLAHDLTAPCRPRKGSQSPRVPIQSPSPPPRKVGSDPKVSHKVTQRGWKPRIKCDENKMLGPAVFTITSSRIHGSSEVEEAWITPILQPHIQTIPSAVSQMRAFQSWMDERLVISPWWIPTHLPAPTPLWSPSLAIRSIYFPLHPLKPLPSPHLQTPPLNAPFIISLLPASPLPPTSQLCYEQAFIHFEFLLSVLLRMTDWRWEHRGQRLRNRFAH